MLLIAALVVLADQGVKWLIVHDFRHGGIVPVIPGFFNLTLVYNIGAAFGIFSGLPDAIRGYVLLAVTAVAFGAVFYYMRSSYGKSAIARVAFALILGGAIGNLIDRARLGMVVDFLDFYFRSYHWPAFNVADSCICVGVMLLILAPGQPKKSV